MGLFLLLCAVVCGFKLGLQAVNLRVEAFVVVAHDADGFLHVCNLQCLCLQLIPGEHLPEKARLLFFDVLDLPQLLFQLVGVLLQLVDLQLLVLDGFLPLG